jgi:hydrogenase maturation protease
MKILSLGNEFRKDDAIALIIAKDLRAIKVFTNPENFIKEGDDVILVDAVDFGAKPGSVKCFKLDEIEEFALSTTHNIGISFLSKICKIKKIIGIQPKNLEYGKGLSKELIDKKNEIIKQVKLLINE